MFKLLFSFLLFFGFYAQSEIQNNWIKTGFFGIDMTIESIPWEAFKVTDKSFELKFGGYINPKNIFIIGAKFGIRYPGLLFEYNYNFINNNSFSSGLYISAVVGSDFIEMESEDGETFFELDELFLSLGMDVGAFLQKSISKKFALSFAAGVSHEPISKKNIDKLSNLTINLSLSGGLKYFFL